MTNSASDILHDEQKISFGAVETLPLGPALETDENDTPTAEQQLQSSPAGDLPEEDGQVSFPQTGDMLSDDYGGGTTNSDNSPGNAGGLSFTTASVADEIDGAPQAQPAPLEPVFASNQVEEDTTMQSQQTSTDVVSPETTSAMMSSTAMSTGSGFYSDNQWSILDGLGLTDLATYNLDGGPTLSQSGKGGDFEAQAFGQVLMGTNSHYSAGGYYDKMQLISDGLLVTSANELNIDAYNTGYTSFYSDFYKGASRHNVHHYQYTAIDASNASGYVTYQGVTKKYWQGDTHLTGKSYEFQNVFKGGDFGNHITGGDYGDTLIGGQGNDTIYGIGGENILYGVGGDNRIDGGSGGSTIVGGTGNDFIVTGTGSNTVVLGNGDNWVVVDQSNLDGTSDANKIVLGSGTDTVVLGNFAPAATTNTSTMSDWNAGLVTDTDVDVGADFVNWASKGMKAGNPLWGTMLSGGNDVLTALVGGTPSEVIGSNGEAGFEATEIMNFNPLTDRLLFPMTSEECKNLAIRMEADGYDLTIYDTNTNEVIAYINFASAAEIFGTSGSLGAAEMKAFGEAMLSSMLFMDANGLTVGAGQNVNDFSFNVSKIDATGTFADDIGDGGYMFAGAWTGNYMFGDASTGIYMGTQLNDVLFGFDVTGKSIDANTGGGAEFHGFGGNNLFATGTGHNLVFGGTGQDTVTYEYALGGIYVDMTDLTIDPDNEANGMHFTVTQDLEGYNVDFLWNVENIIGSIYDDTIVGNDADNTFVSTGGNNTWSGTSGLNTFVLNGGTATVTDFEFGSDTIQIHKSAYVAANVNYQANLKWVEGDDAWMLYDLKNFDNTNPQALVTLDKNDGFDGPVEVELVTHDGSVRSFVPGTWTADHLGIDLVV